MSGPLVSTPLGAPGLRRALVTGASGFVGRVLCRALAAHGVEVVAVTRRATQIEGTSRVVVVDDVGLVSRWQSALTGVDGVVHLAALTHDGARGADDTLFDAVNVEMTRVLAQVALLNGVRRFVYLSSIKAQGERSPREGDGWHRLSARDTPAPEDAYGRSKLAAERGLAATWPMRDGVLTVLRPPLVYGPGAKGNLPRLIALVARGLPVPCAARSNLRSLVQVDNLVDAILLALAVETPGQRCYTLADAEVSTAELARAVAAALGRRVRLLPLPASALALGARLPRMGGALRRLGESLVVDSGAIRTELGWAPRVGFAQGIAAMCAAWRATRA